MATIKVKRGLLGLVVKHLTWVLYVATLILFGIKVTRREWDQVGFAAIILMLLTVFVIDDEKTGLGT